VFSLAGVLYFYDLFRKRARPRVWILEEETSKGPPTISIEVENRGLTATSIEPLVLLKAFLPRPGRTPDKRPKLERFPDVTFNIDDTERTLAAFVPVRLKAIGQHVDERLAVKLGFTWFKTYTFKFSVGGKRKVRVRSADHVPLSWWRYVYERLDFKLRRHVAIPPELEREVTDALSN
jgi:hypothetical protein